MNRENQYDIHKYDEIKVPAGLSEAVKKGLEQGERICKERNKKKNIIKWGSIAAVTAIACSVVVSNPVLAAKIPIVGHVFEMLQGSYSYKGDYSTLATPLQEEGKNEEDSAYTKESGGVKVSFSEVYCNNQAIYLALFIESKEGFPDTLIDSNGIPWIQVETTEKYSFNPSEVKAYRYMEGKMIDKNTYAGILRIPLDEINRDSTEFDKYIEKIGGPEAYEGSQEAEDLIKELDIPESFTMNLSITQIIGDKAEVDTGLDKTEEELEAMCETMPDEEYQKYLDEHRPADYDDFPNQYLNYWFDGSWDYEIAVRIDDSKTQVLEINGTNEKGIGIASVEKTPFEIKVNEKYPGSEEDASIITVALDANGEPLPSGGLVSSTNVYAIQDRDISTVYLYICDWDEYMDFKGYYWSDDYEEKKKEKTFQQLLDEKALYRTEVSFTQ